MEDGVPSQVRASSELQLAALREVSAREMQRAPRHGEPGSVLSGGYAPDSVGAEGSSIIDEPGECGTPVREDQMREPKGF